MQLTGIHHLTAISAKPRDNLAFYTACSACGWSRRPSTRTTSAPITCSMPTARRDPGTDLTFFDFPAAPERRGTNSDFAHRPARRRRKALGYWRDRLKQAGGVTGDVDEVDGRLTLPFEDGEGQRLVLVDDGGAGRPRRGSSSTVPAEHQIRGLGPIVLTVQDLARTAFVLTEVMNMRRVRDYAAPGAQIHVFAMGEGGPAAELHVIERGSAAGAAGRGRRAPCRVPHAGRGAVSCLDASG